MTTPRKTSISFFDKLAILRGMWSIARNPRNLDGVLDLSDRVAKHEDAFDLVPQELRDVADDLPGHRELPPLEELRALPDGTVGREYARFLDANGLVPEALRPLEQEGPLGEIRAHMRGSHDLWHVVTGWGPDLAGELGLQAFYLAQIRAPFPGIVLIAGMIHTLWKAREHTFDIIDAIAEGWRQGSDAKFLPGLRWADWADRPIAELQRAMDIAPAKPRPVEIVPLIDLPAAA